MKKTGALASALRNSGASLPASQAGHEEKKQSEAPPSSEPKTAVPRRQTKAITVHFPEEVRRQLKALAGEQGRHVDDMVAEALNLLFVRYQKAEIAPRKTK